MGFSILKPSRCASSAISFSPAVCAARQSSLSGPVSERGGMRDFRLFLGRPIIEQLAHHKVIRAGLVDQPDARPGEDEEHGPKPQAAGAMQIEIDAVEAAAPFDQPCGLPAPPKAFEFERQGEIETDKAIDRP